MVELKDDLNERVDVDGELSHALLTVAVVRFRLTADSDDGDVDLFRLVGI